MDNHFPDEMTYWSERPTLPIKYKKPKRKIINKQVSYRMYAQPNKQNGGKMYNRICRVITIYFFNIRLFSYKTKI